MLRTHYEHLEDSMDSPWLRRLFELFCRHRFSWPHTGVHGQDYQVCLNCGAAYEFDCETMTRTGRLAAPINVYGGESEKSA